MNQFGCVTGYLSSQCVQCTVQSETVHCAQYTHTHTPISSHTTELIHNDVFN